MNKAVKRSPTDKQWEKWGRENPYFGVLLVESKDVEDPAAKAKFFETGEQHIADLLDLVESNLGQVDRGSALDFGCGVGRLVKPLSQRFQHVYGVDISPDMLELAQTNLGPANNVTFAEDVGELNFVQKLDFVHSFIVLQHIRPPQGLPIIRELVSLLKTGGVFALHFTIGDSKPWRSRLNYARYRIKPLH